MSTESDYRSYGEDQGFRWDEGATIDSLVTFEHDGNIIVNPYSYCAGNVDPASIFGAANMEKWKSECRAEWAEYAKDGAA